MTHPSSKDLVERLRRTERRKSYFATNRTAPIIESEYDAPINPDGTEAAARIEALEAGLSDALDILVDAWRDSIYSMSELDGLRATLKGNGNVE